MNKFTLPLLLFLLAIAGCNPQNRNPEPRNISGIYPSLAHYNNEGECGTGAVVPWAGRLWVITYGPHLPFGSSDKLYEITPGLLQITRAESTGGTPANRMIHKESRQLFIGPYAINNKGNVRVIPYDKMPGRHTGNARHLSDPAGMIYYGTMEEGFYEVDVKTLDVNTLYVDGNVTRKAGQMAQEAELLPGAHGKGLYSGQGVLVYSNNGETGNAALERFDIEAGGLFEWDGTDWKLIRRNQFVEVSGPGGIYGNKNPASDPVWTTGWDHKSILLGVRDPASGWHFYRLPKASHSYDGAHGWNTEWPRIRDVGTKKDPDYLMTMHGMFWRFPGTFSSYNTAGIRPRSAYLKVIGDFARWKDRIVFGCDDAAGKEFLNKRKHKGNIEGPGQSNSNLWFTTPQKPDQLGPVTASGSVWLNESINAGQYAEPFLFAGWPERIAWIHNHGSQKAEFVFETDREGNKIYTIIKKAEVAPGHSAMVSFPEGEAGEWIRISADQPTVATVCFNYSDYDERTSSPAAIFEGIADVNNKSIIGGLLYGLGNERRSLGVSAMSFENDAVADEGYYELDENLNLVPKSDSVTHSFIKEKFAIPQNVIEFDEASVLVTDDKNRRWRLPLGNDAYKLLTENSQLRICRELATERDLFSCTGTFYELPAENADGFAKIRPVASHNFRIHDYASYRGMIVITGLERDVSPGEHVVVSDDGKAALWLGTIDDLWEMGKPAGHGGPWNNSAVKSNEPSDPYLIGFYDKRSLEISHGSSRAVTFRIEVDPTGQGPWMLYREAEVKPGETFKHVFPPEFEARWIRFVPDTDCRATTWLEYN